MDYIQFTLERELAQILADIRRLEQPDPVWLWTRRILLTLALLAFWPFLLVLDEERKCS